ncbi:MAG: AEC family transporter [Chloroflexota bacterium]
MALFWRIFVNNILPAFLVIGAGVLADRTLHIDRKHLARLGLYILAPCLVFNLISKSTVDAIQFGRMTLYGLVVTVGMCGLGLLVGKLLRWSTRQTDGLILSVAFINAGNFGLSVVLFTFGQEGVELASVFFVVTSFAMHTLGAFFANRSHGGVLQALRKAFTLPGPYAFVLALILRSLDIAVPPVIEKPVALIASAAIPVLLMMLGLQLSQTHLGRRYKDVAIGVTMRLVVGALVAIGLAPVLGLQGLARQVGILEASMPTAINSAMVAIEFDADAEFVTGVIFFSTLLSSITLTVLIAFLTH